MEDDRAHPKTAPFRILVLSDLAAGAGRPAQRINLEGPDLTQLRSRLAPAAPASASGTDEQSRERAWRALRFLVERVDFAQAVGVDVIAVSKTNAPEALRRLVRDPELEQPSAEPVSLIVADYEFDASAGDVALLAELGELGMDLYAPVVASVGQRFFGGMSLGELARRDGVRQLFQDPAYEDWRAFRKSEASRWVALGCNRFLLPGAAGDQAVYGNPAFTVALVGARQFAALRWCSQIAGPKTGAIANLPVQPVASGGREVPLPVEAVLSDQVASDLGDAGLIVLVARPGSDTAYVLSTPTTHQPERYQVPAETEQSRLRTNLEHQLFVGRLAQQLEQLAAAAAGIDEAGLESLFEQAVAGMLKLAGEAASDAALAVKVMPTPNHPDRQEVIVNVRPGKLLLGGRITGVLLTLAVARSAIASPP